jgi:hypothetical protein
MPCQSYEDPNDSINERALRDKLARIACKALTHIEESGDGLEILILKDPEIAEWWSAHKENDRKARERREREEFKERMRRSGLSKLNPEEKKALGLK